jgi:hypothetical protein
MALSCDLGAEIDFSLRPNTLKWRALLALEVEMACRFQDYNPKEHIAQDRGGHLPRNLDPEVELACGFRDYTPEEHITQDLKS